MSFIRFALLLIPLFPQFCFSSGLSIHPMEQFVKPSKAAIYFASNRLDEAIAVEVVCESWTITEEGEEIRSVTNDLVAYPSQFILKGNTYKKVRVVPRNPRKEIPLEKPYRVTIRELPISLEPVDPGTFRIHHASAYRTSFYLQARKRQPDVEVLESSFEDGVLSLRLHNKGNAHIHLTEPRIELHTKDGKKITVTDLERLKGLEGENMHPQITRQFKVDLSEETGGKAVSRATLDYRGKGEKHEKHLELTW